MLFGERLKKQGGRTSRNRESRPLVVRALLVSLFGLAVRVRTAGHTPDRTSDRRTAEGQVPDEPNTTGIYSVMRNPLYVGDLFKWPGIALSACSTAPASGSKERDPNTVGCGPPQT